MAINSTSPCGANGTEEAKPRRYLAFRVQTELGPGRCSSISVLSESQTALIVNDFNFSRSLNYTVGKVSRKMATISWQESIYYTTGKCPSVALLYYNGETLAIEVHCTLFFKCHYNVWKIERECGRVVGKCDGTELGTGSYSKVSAMADGHIIIVYESAIGNAILYAFGKLVASNKTVEWKHMKELFPEKGVNVSIASSKDKIIVAYRCAFSNVIKCVLGSLDPINHEISWENIRIGPAEGLYPSISMNCYNNFVLSYQSLVGRSLGFVYGEVTNRSILWQYEATKEEGAVGEYPCVALSDFDQIYIVHKTPFGSTTYLRTGSVMNERITMENISPNEES